MPIAISIIARKRVETVFFERDIPARFKAKPARSNKAATANNTQRSFMTAIFYRILGWGDRRRGDLCGKAAPNTMKVGRNRDGRMPQNVWQKFIQQQSSIVGPSW